MELPAPAPGRSHYWALDPNRKVLFKEGNYHRRMPRSWRRPVSTAHPYYPPMPRTMTADIEYGVQAFIQWLADGNAERQSQEEGLQAQEDSSW